MVYCVYVLESPRRGDSNENVQYTSMSKKIEKKNILIMSPDQTLLLTLISSIYPCLEYIFIVPKVLEPLKFYFIFFSVCCVSIFFTFNCLAFYELFFLFSKLHLVSSD